MAYSCTSSTDWIVAIALSSRSAISRLVVSSRRERAVSPSSAAASRVRSTPSACTWAARPSSLRSACFRRSTAASSASNASARRLTAVSIALCSVIAFGPHQKLVRQQLFRQRILRVARPHSQRLAEDLPSCFRLLCMEGARGGRHIDSRDLHAIHRPKGPFMSAKASSTAAAMPPEHREQAPAAPAIAHACMANAIRALAMDAVEQARSGHPGMPMGMADVATVLFSRFLRFDPTDPAWPDRDRFVLSAGHGSMLIYALLHLTGYEAMTLDEIKRFRQLGSITAGHPEFGHAPGIETTTGPLGQGLANAVGMAIAEKHLAAVFSSGIVDHHTYVLASDGDLMEGVSQEAIALAGHLRLNKLIVLFDDNTISIDGPLSLSDSVDQIKRFEAAGWAATRVDGHDPEAIARALEKARTSSKPSLIACKTT